MSDYNIQFSEACSSFASDPGKTISVLEDIAIKLAQSQELRQQIGAGDPPVWSNLRALWKGVVDKRNEEDEKEGRMCVGLAKFTRNLVAGVEENQTMAYENEPAIRQLLHHYSSWSVTKDVEAYTMTRILSQTLSNLVTNNEMLMSNLWTIYMSLTEDRVILLRLLALPDARTVLAALVLILNCIHGSQDRASMLCTTAIGARICVSLLDGMVRLYDAEDSDGARAFDVGYSIFTCLVEDGLIPDLYTKLSVPDEPVTPHQTTLLKLLDSYLQSARMPINFPSLMSPPPDESMSTEDTQISPTESARQTELIELYWELAPMLCNSFLGLTQYATEAVKRALGRGDGGIKSAENRSAAVSRKDAGTNRANTGASSGVVDTASTWFEDSSSGTESGTEESTYSEESQTREEIKEPTGRPAFDEPRSGESVDDVTPRPSVDGVTPRRSVDDITPRTSSDITKRPDDEDSTDRNSPPAQLDVLLPNVCEALVLVTQCIVTIGLEAEDNAVMYGGENLKDVFNENRDENGQGIVESLIELLRLLDDFLPRINFGNPVLSLAASSSSVLAATGFSYLKRDLVRLLGILCYQRRSVQDIVRELGGLEIVMNLCVIDERNPYIREHAILTLRNLLAANRENQAVVDAIQPTRDWDEEGVLQ